MRILHAARPVVAATVICWLSLVPGAMTGPAHAADGTVEPPHRGAVSDVEPTRWPGGPGGLPHRSGDRPDRSDRSLPDPFAPLRQPGWERILELPEGRTVEVTVRPEFWLRRPDESLGKPEDRVLVGSLADAEIDGLVLLVERGAMKGRWGISREAVGRVRVGSMERDPPWEGIFAGFGIAFGLGTLLAVDEDITKSVILYTGVFYGTPLALVCGLTDYLHRDFSGERVVYERP